MMLQTSSSKSCHRVSVFQEIGIFDDKPSLPPPNYEFLIRSPTTRTRRKLGFSRFEKIVETEEGDMQLLNGSSSQPFSTLSSNGLISRKRIELLAIKISLIFTTFFLIFHLKTILGPSQSVFVQGVAATPLHGRSSVLETTNLHKRADSPTSVCKRWSHQSALVNGTLYLYGGQATTTSSQSGNTWNNNFLTIDLKSTWPISQPPLKGLAQPNGPPPVANGYLWNSYDSLFMYGGLFSDTPPVKPSVSSLWEYSIRSSSWKEHKTPSSSVGKNSEPAGQTIERSAEGAGFSVASLGMGWYFGGHLDGYTSSWWSQSTPRLYLRSFVEYTFPGHSNDAVDTLNNGRTAGDEGVWRNITQAGIQDQAGFTERADGILIWIPRWGSRGSILSLAGGTNESFTQMNTIDVYDIAESAWYRQSTSGPTPQIRVNPCAVAAAAPDGSSYQIHMFGGQNLIPYGNQTQYNDMWILSVPSFTWIKVDTTSQSTPYPRAGHTCNIWDAQMIVVGGFVPRDITCESPGVYVFNTSSLQWSSTFTALSADMKDNPFSQQLGQKGDKADSGLQGSYGYAVPKAVYDVIGGGPTGGATATAPVATATAGPFATSKPSTYPIVGGNPSIPGSQSSKSKVNVGAAVAGAVAGFFFLIACYLAFCALVYRKQLQIYQEHTRTAGAGTPLPDESAAGGGLLAGAWRRASFLPGRSSAGKHSTEGSRFSGGAGSFQQTSSNVTETTPALASYPHSAGGQEGTAASFSPAGSYTSLNGQMEPSYWGVLLHPRRSLRVINR